MGLLSGVTTYNRMELSTMVRIQYEETLKRRQHKLQNVDVEHAHVHDESQHVNIDEITMIGGVLRFRDMLVKEVMTEEVFMLSMNDRFSSQVSIVICVGLWLTFFW